MNIMQIAGLATTSRGWQRMQAMNLSIPVLAWTLVVPLSLLPAMLLYYAGTHYGDDFIQGFSARNWHFISTTFFLTELLSFFIMGWLIHSVLEGHKLNISYHDAYLVAAFAPVPMWLSSLGLLIPVVQVTAAIAAVGLVASCVLVFTGIRSLCRRQADDVVSMSATYTVMSAAVLAWVLLMVVIWAY